MTFSPGIILILFHDVRRRGHRKPSVRAHPQGHICVIQIQEESQGDSCFCLQASISTSLNLALCLPVSICVCLCLSVCVCLFVSIFVRLSVYLSVYLSVCLPVRVSRPLYIYLSIFLILPLKFSFPDMPVTCCLPPSLS